MVRIVSTTLALVCLASIAHAHPHRQQLAVGCNQLWPCEAPSAASSSVLAGVRSIDAGITKEKRVSRPERARHSAGIAEVSARAVSQVIGGRPAGCPSRFCGCGASLHLYGRIIPSLNLAANWLRFPRAAPAPKMVAVRRGHVFVLEEHIGGDTWLVHDSNSGGQRTRLHARSIAGYAIVNPSGHV
jgi:hypothetical protein